MKKNNLKDKFVRVDMNNIGFLSRVMPRSTPDFHEIYWINANKYWSCIQVHDFPEYSSNYFLAELINQDNAVIMLDMEHMSQSEADMMFSKYLEAKNDDLQMGRKIINMFRDQNKIEQLLKYQKYLESTKDGNLSLTFRIYVYEDTLEKLIKLMNYVLLKLRNLKMEGYIQTNDLLQDYRAVTMFDDCVREVVPSSFVADCFMYNNLSRVDPYVSLIGYTSSGGLYAIDNFNFRYSSFNRLLSGATGSGKSALVKLHDEDMILKHEKVFKLDLHNEYEEIFNRYGLTSVSFNEKMHINLCEVFAVQDIKDGIIKDVDITSRISLVSNIIREQSKIEQQTVIQQLKAVLHELYQPYLKKKLIDIHHEDWFILQDILEFVKEKRRLNEDHSAKNDLYVLELALKEMVDTYGFIYNHHTNVDINLSESVRFDLSFLQEERDRYVKSAYLTMVASYLQQAMYINEKENYALMEEKGISLYELERPALPMKISIDEFDSYFWCRTFIQAVYDLINFARKSFVSIELIVHGIDGILDDKNKENADLLQEIVNLCCMKFIGKTDGMKDTFSKIVEGITVEDMISVSKFTKGADGQRRFLAIDELKEKIVFTSIVTNKQKEYFKGGR